MILSSGCHGALGTLKEQKFHFTLLRSVASKSADYVSQSVIDLLSWAQ
jgi:hypothetical protein